MAVNSTTMVLSKNLLQNKTSNHLKQPPIMKIFIYNYKYIFSLLISFFIYALTYAQRDTVVIETAADTLKPKLSMDAVYNRPFLKIEKLPIAIGGYLEANTQYSSTDGVSDGFSFQARRLTLFFSSTIAKKLKFLSELEFEDGGKEINIEFAALDMEFHPLLNLRG